MSEEVRVAVEGMDTEDGRRIAPGALRLPVGAVPVTAPGSDRVHVVGQASGFRREAPYVLATIDMLEGDLPPWVSPAVEVDHAEIEYNEGALVVKEARIRSIHLVSYPPGAAWPELNRRA